MIIHIVFFSRVDIYGNYHNPLHGFNPGVIGFIRLFGFNRDHCIVGPFNSEGIGFSFKWPTLSKNERDFEHRNNPIADRLCADRGLQSVRSIKMK